MSEREKLVEVMALSQTEREKLRAEIAMAICMVGCGIAAHRSDYFGEADAALSAIEAAGVRLVPVETFAGPAAWLDRWAQHVGNCKGGHVCTCGLTFVRTEARAALEQTP